MATFDARPIINAGGEPFGEVMKAADALAPGEDLIMLAPFDPVPLKGVLGSKGFIFDTVERDDGDWEITFRRPL